jgi:DNA-binding CsgD family transcriptional regulator
MPYGRPWLPEEDELGKEMLLQGKSYKEVARVLKRSYVAVFHRNKTHWKAAHFKPHWSAEDEAIAKRLLSDGHTYREVAKRMNRSASSIRTKNYRNWQISNMKPRPRIKSSTRDAYYSKKAREKRNFSEKRVLCLLRDKLTCRRCGVYDRSGSILVVHHIDGNGRGKPVPNNSLVNMVTLCLRCHAKIHHSKGREVANA